MVAGTSSSRGLLVVFEGLDRVGKSTQAQLLLQRITQSGKSAELLKFPDRTTEIGNCINEYLTNAASKLSDRTIHLLFSANRWEKEQEMREKLLAGTTLIVDRYAFSGVAYTCAKGLPLEWCKSCDVGLIRPDLVVFLELDPECAQKRAGYGDERYEKVEFQRKTLQVFKQLRDESWMDVNASENLDKIEKEIFEAYKEKEKLCADSLGLQKLWTDW